MADNSAKLPNLGLDSIVSLRIHGLARDNNGDPIEVVLPRTTAYESRKVVVKSTTFAHKYLPSLPTLPPPLPPTGGDIVLEVELGKTLPESDDDGSDGGDSDITDEDYQVERTDSLLEPEGVERSWVYTLRVINPEAYPFYIPLLVLKVASERDGRRVAREGGMYHDLESIQGLVVPRCYGYFRTSIDLRAMMIEPWDPKCDYPRGPDTFDIFRPPHPSASLNVLLLERVGGPLPHNSLPAEPLREELLLMFEELVRLGVDHEDVHERNILFAPESPPGLEGVHSPQLKRPFKYRIIDFEHAVRVNETPSAMQLNAQDFANDIVDNVGKRH